MDKPWDLYDANANMPAVDTSGTWDRLAKRVANSLSRDLSITPDQAAGIVGQLGYESEGLQAINERNPVVPGSRGGFGWAQWTGPRRRAFERWAKENDLSVDSADANYGFLVHELNTTERGTLDKIREAPDAITAGQAFTQSYLRPGIVAQDKRDSWTNKALGLVMSDAQAQTDIDPNAKPWELYAQQASQTNIEGIDRNAKPWELYANAMGQSGDMGGPSRPGILDQAKSDFSRGVSNLKNIGTGIAALGADALGADDTAQNLLDQYVREAERIQRENPAVIGSYKNIESMGDFGRYAVEAIAENLPMFIPSLVSGGIGAIAARKAAEKGVQAFVENQVSRGIARSVAEKNAARMVSRRVVGGTAAGSVPTSIGIESGMIYGDTFQETGKREPGLAVAFGVPAGLLDSIEPVYALSKIAGPAVKELAGGVIKRMGTEAGKQFLIEAGTEGLQEMLEEAPKSISTGQPYWTPELLDQVIDASLKGGLAGGAIGGVTAPFHSGAKPESTADQYREIADERSAQEAAAQGIDESDRVVDDDGQMRISYPKYEYAEDNDLPPEERQRRADERRAADQQRAGRRSPPALPAPRVRVDEQGNARMEGVQAPKGVGIQQGDDVQQGAANHPGADTSLAAPKPPLALPSPVIDVDEQGMARTADQRQEQSSALDRLEAWAQEMGYTKDVQRAGTQHPGSPQPVETPVDEAAHTAQTSPLAGAVEPTDGQKKAGNYRLGHVKVGGLDISIENPEGSERRGTDESGKPWVNRMAAHYGYVKRTEGADGDQVDVFVRPGTPEDYAGRVFVVDQVDPRSGKFDEHKVMIGYDSQQDAEAAYRASYDEGWNGLGKITPMDMPAFKEWLKNGDTTRPVADAASIGTSQRTDEDDGRATQAPAQTSSLKTSKPTADLSRQNRDRTRPASIEQMNRIASNPDYDRLGFGRSPNEAAPMVSVARDAERIPEDDMGRTDRVTLGDGSKIPVHYAVVEADSVLASHRADGTENADYYADPKAGEIRALNNGRTAGIQEAYRRGTADDYRQAMVDDAAAHGVAPEAILSKRAPMLVRVYDDRENQRKDIGKLSNLASNLGLSVTEQAANDARLVPIDLLDLGDSGSFGAVSNRRFLQSFATALQNQGEDASQVIDGQGNYSRQFMDRARAAVFHKAYGDEGLTAVASESADPDVRNILNALTMAAPDFAGVEAGALDIRPHLSEAVSQIRDARSRGLNMQQHLAQQDMFGRDQLTDRLTALLWGNIRAPRRMSEALREMALFIQNEQARAANVDMFGGTSVSISDVIERGENLIRSRYGREQDTQQADLFSVGRSEGGRRADETGPAGGQQAGRGRTAPEDARYAGTEESAGNQVEEPGGEQRELFGGFDLEPGVSKNRGAHQPAARPVDAGRRTVPRAGGLPSLKSKAAAVVIEPEGDQFAVRVEAKKTVDLKVQDGPIASAADVASALASIRKHPQENLLMLLTDKDGRPISVLRHSIGQKDQTQASPDLLIGHAARVPKAANMWLVHNHPTGNPGLSSADKRLSENVARIMRGSRIEYQGLMAVGLGSFSNVDGHGNVTGGQISPVLRATRVPVMERAFVRRGALAEPIKPETVSEIAHKVAGGKDGVLLLDTQFIPTAFVPMDAATMGKLRGTGGLERLLAGVEKSNAVNAVAVVQSADNISQARNLNSALSAAGVRPLDIVAGDKPVANTGQPVKRRGDDILFESRAPRPSAGVSDSGHVDQTKTAAFKRWFGDWEALRAQKRLDESKPVRVRIPDDWRGLPVSELRSRVRDALTTLADSGEPLRHPEIGDVQVTRNTSVKKPISSSPDPAKLYVLGDLRHAFERSIYASERKPLSIEPGVAAYQKLLAKVEIDGTDLVAIFTVRRMTDGKHFYNAVTLSDGQKKTPAVSPRDTPASGERATSANTGVSSFIRRTISRVNPDSVSKVVDENGKPLVVYHGTDQSFSEFKGKAWFTPVAADASMHSKTVTPGADHRPNVMPVYLNIRKPKIIRTYATRADIDAAEASGKYDGVIVRGVGGGPVDHYIAFGPSQIKSATGNRGTFDPNRSNVNESKARTRQPGGVNVLNAQRHANAFMRKLPGAARLKVTVVQSTKDIPEAVKPSTLAEGVYYPKAGGGRIYLVADNLGSMNRVDEVLVHEVIGHFGVEALLGGEFDSVLSDVRRLARVPYGERATGKEQLGDKNYATMEAVGMRYSDYDAKGRAREVLARMAEENRYRTFLATVYAKIRKALRALGIDLKLSTADLREMVVDAGKFLRKAPADQVFSGAQEAVASMAASEGGRSDNNLVRVVSVSGAEMGGPDVDVGDLRSFARAWANSNLKGKSFENKETGWKVSISSRGIKESLSRSARRSKIQSIPALPDLIASGIHGATAENHNKQRDPFTSLVHTLYAPLDIGPDRYIARMVVKENQNGHFFYDHDLSTIEKRPDNLSAVSTPATKAGADRINSERTMTIDELRSIVKAEGRRGWDFDDKSRQKGSGGSEATESRGVAKHGTPERVRARILAEGHARDGGILRQDLGPRESRIGPQEDTQAPPSAGLFDGPRDSRAAAMDLPHLTGVSAAEQQARDSALGKIGIQSRRESIQTRLADIRENGRARAVQGVLDHFMSLKALSPRAYMQARLSKGSDGAAEYMVRHGAVELREGALDGKKLEKGEPGSRGFKDILQSVAGEHDHLLAWIAGNRAERLMAEGREKLFTKDDIGVLKRLNRGTMPDGRKRAEVYAQAAKEIAALNRYTMDLAQEAGLIDGESRHLWEHEFYVPFYRIMEEDNTGLMGPGQINGLVGQYAFKKLKGGTERLGDLAANMVANWSHLLSASMKNLAAQEAMKAAVEIGIARKINVPQKGSVRIMVNGKEHHFLVDDPMVLESLQALHWNGYNGPWMKAMGKFKRTLTIGVTLSPTFRIRNVLRDSMQAIAVDSDIPLNPLINMVKGWKSTGKDTDTMRKLLAGGGAVRFGSFNDGQARNLKRLVDEGLIDDRGQVLSSPADLRRYLRKAFDWYQELGDRGETVNRAAIYEAAIKNGKSHLEASFLARDLMDFTNTGAWASVRALTQVIPFLNARLQGSYKLGRGAQNDFARFSAVTGTIAMASAALYLMMKDDDDYKELPDWARNTYWAAKIPGTDKMIFIPKPFEVGALASVVERGTELAFGGDDFRLKDFAKQVYAILDDQLELGISSLAPQMFMPAIEASFNYDTFRQRNIDNMAQERLPAGERFTTSTSAGAIALGRALDVSPQRIEHLASGYFGWLGVQALNVADYLVRPLSNLPENPRRDITRIDNIFVVGDFVKEPNARSSKYIQRFYDMQKEVNQVYAAYNQARATGDMERASDLSRSDEARLYGLARGANKEMTKITQRIRALERDHRPMDEKRAQLDELYRLRNQLAAITDQRARALQ